MRSPQQMLINASMPAKPDAEFVAYATTNPGGQLGRTPSPRRPHVRRAFQLMAGVKLHHVPYHGGRWPCPT